MKKQSPSACERWLNKYNTTGDTFFGSLTLTQKTTNEAKIITFQFKILHNILNTKENLYKWDICESEICTNCDDNYIDDIVHEFTGCKQSKQIINAIAKDLGLLKEFKKISKTEFVFGTPDLALNNIILLAKYTIHTNRQKYLPFSLDAFRKELYKRIVSDSRSLSLTKFDKKWGTHTDLVMSAKTFFKNLCS